ncbi:MAG: hypothetical protein HY287_17540 [Planctomycetes bacterium]|nr:hypothetical protein [Planctomycetota bacterium]
MPTERATDRAALLRELYEILHKIEAFAEAQNLRERSEYIDLALRLRLRASQLLGQHRVDESGRPNRESDTSTN